MQICVIPELRLNLNILRPFVCASNVIFVALAFVFVAFLRFCSGSSFLYSVLGPLFSGSLVLNLHF